MKIVGLITEYNPFHNGHKYHIDKAKELTGADAVIVVMSGDFVQRGIPAIMPKHLRAKAALEEGASLVLELPVCYATGSAEFFAYGAVSLLHNLGCVNAICFGSECGNMDVLESLAKIISEEPEEYKTFLNKYLKEGNSFPLARQKAMKDYMDSDEMDTILSEPNNILGIEYLKALYRLKSNMKPYTIQRISSHYHNTDLQESFSSASAIRRELKDCALLNLHGQIPDSCIAIMKDAYQSRYPVYANDFSLLLKYKLLGETKDSLAAYADVSEELANRIINRINDYINFDQFCALLKTREITYSRISRALIHILLDIRKTDYQEIEYARILGFRKEDARVLSLIKSSGFATLISKLTTIDMLSDQAQEMIKKDIFAADLYESVVTEKFKTTFKNEYQQQIICL